MKKGKIFKTLAIFGTCLCAPLLLTGCGKDETQINFRVEGEYIQWTEDGKTWTNLIEFDELQGEQGVQGPQGIQGEQGQQGEQGIQGVAGKQVEFNVSSTHIQWRYVGDETWNNLIALEDIKGDKGDDGEDGEDVSVSEYTITYNYNINVDVSETMTNYKTSQTVKSNEWITEMPYLNNDTDHVFMGWFIQGTNKQIENYDFIGEDVVLEAKWDIDYSGIQSIYYNADLDGYNCVIDNKNLTNINLPNKIIGSNGYKDIVKLSGDINGLYENSSLTSVKLPSNLKILGDYLFKGSNIENITIPQSVEEIGDHTFYGCENLTDITTYATLLKPYAFSGCSNLRNVNLMGNSIILSENAFSSCAIEEITLDAEEIGKHAFMSNESLTDIILSENLKTLSEEPFLYCSNLNNVYYNGTIDLWATINFFDQTSTPMYYAQHFFIDDTKITNLDLSNVVEINDYAFAYFKEIIEINISSKTTRIGEKAFLNCNSLQKLTLPFVGATLEDETNTTLGYLFGERNIPESLTEFVFNGNKLSTNALNFTKIEILNLKGNITDFNDYGVGSTLKTIYIPNSATNVTDSAFYGNSNLINIYYDGDINDWLALNFTNATSTPMHYAKNIYFKGEEVTEINIPTNIRKLNNYSLSGFNIKSVEIPENIIDIGEGVFSSSKIEEIIIPEQITNIPEFAFSSCNELKTVEFKANTVEICASAFRNCVSLVDIDLQNVSNIGEFAFSGCESLANVILSNYLQVAIGSCAFQSCVSLESIIIYDNLVSIGNNCFNACGENLKIFIEFTHQPESWSADWLSSNSAADKIAKHAYWFSENQPTTDGNYWYYDTDEKTPIVW